MKLRDETGDFFCDDDHDTDYPDNRHLCIWNCCVIRSGPLSILMELPVRNIKDFLQNPSGVLGSMPEIQQFIIKRMYRSSPILAFTAMIMMVWSYGIISPIPQVAGSSAET